MAEDGPHSPGPRPDAVRWLVDERDVHGCTEDNPRFRAG